MFKDTSEGQCGRSTERGEQSEEEGVQMKAQGKALDLFWRRQETIGGFWVQVTSFDLEFEKDHSDYMETKLQCVF